MIKIKDMPAGDGSDEKSDSSSAMPSLDGPAS